MNSSRNTWRLVLVFAVVAAASAALGVIGTILIKSPAQVAADTAPPPVTVLTSKVTNEVITNTLLMAGTVSAGNSIALTPQAPLDGSIAAVTGTPIPVGGSFSAGQVVVEISDRPLIVLASSIPLLRDLSLGMSGADVQRLQDALRAAGIPDTDKAGRFGPSTAAAVARLYSNDGYAPPQQAGAAFVSRSEIALAPLSSNNRVVSLGAPVGGLLTGSAVTISTHPPGINAQVDAGDADNVHPGMKVTATIGQQSLAGTITAVGAAVNDPTNGFEAPVTVSLDEPLPEGSIGGSAQVSTNISTSTTKGLTVPLGALYSDASGANFVITIKNRNPSRIPITVTETGDGEAQIVDRSDQIKVGDSVQIGASG